jgi:hypothetical protein
MADEAKVPGKAAHAAKESVKDTKEAVEETAEQVAPTLRGHWKAFRQDPDVKEIEDMMKPVLPPVAFGVAALVNPPLAAAGAAYVAGKRIQRHYAAKAQDQTNKS